MERIGFGPRFLAWLIDIALVIFVIYGISYLYFGDFSVDLHVNKFGYFGRIVFINLAFAYTFLEVLMGQTIGKMLLKLKIMNADGTKANLTSLLTRWAIKYSSNIINLISTVTALEILNLISIPIGLIVAAGCFMIFSLDKLTLYDKLTNTSVFKTNQS